MDLIEEKLKDIPDRIPFGIQMTKVNQTLPIYQGKFQLMQEENAIEINGNLFFEWFPSPCARFNGELTNRTADLSSLHRADKFELIIDGLSVGECFLTNTSISSTVSLEGKLTTCVTGDKSINVSSINFAVPNLRYFMGASVKVQKEQKVKLENSRVALENEEYLIQLDKAENYEEIKRSLDSQGGYILLYSGSIVSKKGTMSFADVRDIVHQLHFFLSFLNGRKSSPLFLQASFDHEVKWSDFTPYIVDQYKSVVSWPIRNSIEGLDKLWLNWRTLYKDEAARDVLKSAIHWYLEANSNVGYVEGSIILTQTGLELMYNWLIVEKKKIILGADSENLSAANKIRLILNQLRLNPIVPSTLKNLTAFVALNKDIADGPDCFVQIRNAIVHSQQEKRKKLGKISLNVRYEALQLGLWYLELCILYEMGFDGKYANRTTLQEWAGQGEQKVPWIN
ncbi:MAG TPA: hypothetical protein VFU05_17680 [Cyclobacteriaceae bacterium]|nr:hypothetical protein [Cyclobacteriaceae bacterium]